MKKSQSSLFFIFGLILIIVMGIYVSYVSTNKAEIISQENKKSIEFSDMRTDIYNYIHSCVKDSAKDSILDTGIREETISQYKQLVASRIKDCTTPFFGQLREQDYLITEGEIFIAVDLSPETIDVTIEYPLTIEYEKQKIDFNDFDYVFDRSVSVKIPGGITERETTLISSNEKAKIVIPKGVKITDRNGNPVENLGLRVEDRKFDDLENNYVVGQLVYEGFPDGISFSEPVELSIEFREEDLPLGYTRDNIKVGYWDENDGIWYAIHTSLKDDRAVAEISHFTNLADLVIQPYMIVQLAFMQRFTPYGANPPTSSGEPGKKVWLIGGTEEDQGTASLQNTYFSGTYSSTPPSFLDRGDGIIAVKSEAGDEYEDFEETLENNKGNYLAMPNLQYGYLLGENFIDCEKKNTIDGINFLDGTYPGYPHFKFCDEECKKGLICKCDGEIDCESTCDEIQTCFGKSKDNYLCIPNGEERADSTVSCTKIASGSACSPDSENIFGWHNFQCAGGKVTPSEGEASYFIKFKPNGNAVLYRDIPLVEDANINDMISMFNNMVDKIKKIPLSDKLLDLPIVTKIIDKADGLNYDVPLREFDFVNEYPTYSTNVIDRLWANDEDWPYYCEITPFSKGEKYKIITDKQKGPRVEVYGINVIKKVGHAQSKTELHAKCELYWVFLGNGFDRANTPPDLTSTGLEEGLKKVIKKITEKENKKK